MPRDRDFKKLVRQRMGKTGESFTAARAQLLALSGTRRPSSRQGETGMYPFDRFTEPAKDVLTCAQQEAEASDTGYIGTEHMLLGLLTCGGAAAAALQRLGVDSQPVREAIRSRLSFEEPEQAGRVQPAKRMKTVIELAFGEAGTAHVGTEHLLLGILIEGDGVGASVLAQWGDGRSCPQCSERGPRARCAAGDSACVRLVHGNALHSGRPSSVRRGLPVGRQRGRHAAAKRPHTGRPREARQPGACPGCLARAVGADLDDLRRKLKPPRKITQLEAEIWRLRQQKEEATAAGDERTLAGLRQRESELRGALARSLDAWQARWGRTLSV